MYAVVRSTLRITCNSLLPCEPAFKSKFIMYIPVYNMYLLLSECKVLVIILFGETSTVNSELKQQCAVKPQERQKLQDTGRATRAPVAQTLQSVRQTCPRTTATYLYTFARFPSCGIFTPTRAIPDPSETTS